jgi:hypothetical protein
MYDAMLREMGSVPRGTYFKFEVISNLGVYIFSKQVTV